MNPKKFTVALALVAFLGVASGLIIAHNLVYPNSNTETMDE